MESLFLYIYIYIIFRFYFVIIHVTFVGLFVPCVCLFVCVFACVCVCVCGEHSLCKSTGTVLISVDLKTNTARTFVFHIMYHSNYFTTFIFSNAVNFCTSSAFSVSYVIDNGSHVLITTVRHH